ncbi:MAG: BamA/TamA family outer membrane protein [Bryobacteraceae bacterium]
MPRTRAEIIQAERQQRAQKLTPERLSGTESFLHEIKRRRIVERLFGGIGGWRLRFGGLPPRSGFGLGPEYLRRDLANGNVIFRASARASTRKYYILESQVVLPELGQGRYYLDFYNAFRNSPRIDYYGPGPDSREQNRTNFRLEETPINVAGTLNLTPAFRIGLTGGFLGINVGPGTHPGLPSTEQVFSPAAAPGIQEQSNYLRGGPFVQFDYRDNPGGPRRGGNYTAQFVHYSDLTSDLFSFGRLDLNLEQYFPFLNERRVVALRALTSLSFTSSGQTVPFYLQPIVGGPDTLRGFPAFRFYGNNALITTAEYRWEVFSGMDAALFVEGGKVFDRVSQLNFHGLEASGGFGLRFNVRNNVFMRFDVGFSREGAQVWLRFDNIF